MIELACPNCRKPVEFAQRYAGCAMHCLHCRHSLMVPWPADGPSTGPRDSGQLAQTHPAEGLGFLGVVLLMSLFGAGLVFAFLVIELAELGDGLSAIEAVFWYLALAATGCWAGFSALYLGEGRSRVLTFCLAVLLAPLVLIVVGGILWVLVVCGVLTAQSYF